MSTTGPALHLLATAAALIWARHERRIRPPPRNVARLATGAAATSMVADVLLILFPVLPGLITATMTLAFIIGLAVLMTSLLQGWPSRAVLMLGALAVMTPFSLLI